MSERPLLVLTSATEAPCGVEAFARGLAERLGSRGRTFVLDRRLGALWRAMRASRGIVFNFPVVAWKRKLLMPLLAAILARLSRRKVTVILHEWADLDWKRRAVLWPVAQLAHALLFSAPEIAAQFAGGSSPRDGRHRAVLPIPPNIPTVNNDAESAYCSLLDQWRRQGRLILGQFGSLYPKKRSLALLEIAATLLPDGHDVGVVFIGDFVSGEEALAKRFAERVEALGLTGRVVITGYVDGGAELHGLFRRVDVFCYLFADGLTARRGSVLTAALSGRPVVVNAAADGAALARHALFRHLIAVDAIHLLAHGAGVADAAQAVLLHRDLQGIAPSEGRRQIDLLWQQIMTVLEESPDDGTAPGGATTADRSTATD